MLFGRPWIHPARETPSTLHQNVKYVIDGLLVVVYGEREFATFEKPSIPYIGVSKETEPASYQVFELFSATFTLEAKPARKLENSEAHLSIA